MHKLLIEDDEGKTVVVPLIREEITIGRLEGNTIRLTEQNVSRKHARLALKGGVLSIEDLGSYNGTSLNGSSLTGIASLKDGDVILIGDYRLGIQEEKTAHAEPPAVRTAEAASPAGVPAVQDALDAQPTIPISTMAVQAAALSSELPARLVVMSRFISGTEFLLDRPSIVIGRTPENDIIINHKSISRHHAKVVRDGERYVILDLESANGVRVNGAENERCELQAGDVIELGEVRLRFVTGDSALYDDQPAWYRNKRKLAVLLGAVAVASGVLLVVIFSGGSAGTSVTPPPPEPGPTAMAQPAPTPPPVPAPEPAKPAEPSVPIAELLAEAKTTAQAEKWDEALALIAKATLQEPGSEDAANLRKAIEAEKQYNAKLAELQAALDNNEFDLVMQGAGEIPPESMYKPQAIELHQKAQAQFVVAHLQNASTSFAAKDCDEARREAELVLSVDAKNKKAGNIVRRCEPVAAKPELVAAAPKPEHAPKPEAEAGKPASRRVAAAKPTKPGRAEAGKHESVSPGDADKLIRDAQQAWLRGQHAVAIDNARKALRAKPGLTNAYQIIAICSCALRDADSAARAYEKLDDRNKDYVKRSCQKYGIPF